MLIAGIGGAVTFGATNAFFSDTETSTGNVFAAGAIDLLIDNESYYNGEFNEETSWEPVDLTIEKFFDFDDLKPGDYGEDTISFHVDTNDAYICADMSLTSNNENGCNEPEGLVDGTCGDPGEGEGELAGLVNFIWWADDGDNVLEDNEVDKVFFESTMDELANVVVLADSDENVWDGEGGPVDGDTTYYIAKAWCFGDIGTAPLPQDGESDVWSPDDDNDNENGAGQPEDGGFTCDGSALGNESQTDSVTADISFEALQARHNPDFQCKEDECTFDEQVDLLTATAKFEDPEVDTAQNWDIFDSPVDGWTVGWRDDIPASFGNQDRPEVAHLEYHEGVLGDAFEGDQYAELDTDWGGPSDSGTGEPASVTIYRNFATVPGADYILRYHFAPRPNTSAADNHLEVEIDGSVEDTAGPVAGGAGAINWSEREVNFTAVGALTEIRFTDRGTANSLGTFIDNVRLYQISCPNGDINNGVGDNSGR